MGNVYTADDASKQVDVKKKQEELQLKAKALLDSNTNVPTGAALMTEEAAKELGVNRLTGLPFGYQAGDKLKKETTADVTQARAAESGLRRDDNQAKANEAINAIVAPFDNQGSPTTTAAVAPPTTNAAETTNLGSHPPGVVSPTKAPNYLQQHAAARAAYNVPLTESSGQSELENIKNAGQRMQDIQEQARQGQEAYFKQIDTSALRDLAINNPKAFEAFRQKKEAETGGTSYQHLQDYATVPPKQKVDTSEFYTQPSFLDRLINRSVITKTNPYRSAITMGRPGQH